ATRVPFVVDGRIRVDGSNLPDEECAEVSVQMPVGDARTVSFPTSGHGCTSNLTERELHFVGTLPPGDSVFSVTAHTGEMDGSHALGTFDVTLRFEDGCTIEGTSGGETLPGTGGNDVICGLGG